MCGEVPIRSMATAHALALYAPHQLRHMFQIGICGPISSSIPAATRRLAACLRFLAEHPGQELACEPNDNVIHSN